MIPASGLGKGGDHFSASFSIRGFSFILHSFPRAFYWQCIVHLHERKHLPWRVPCTCLTEVLDDAWFSAIDVPHDNKAIKEHLNLKYTSIDLNRTCFQGNVHFLPMMCWRWHFHQRCSNASWVANCLRPQIFIRLCTHCTLHNGQFGLPPNQHLNASTDCQFWLPSEWWCWTNLSPLFDPSWHCQGCISSSERNKSQCKSVANSSIEMQGDLGEQWVWHGSLTILDL